MLKHQAARDFELYFEARIFPPHHYQPGLRTFILGHEKRASTNLFRYRKTLLR